MNAYIDAGRIYMQSGNIPSPKEGSAAVPPPSSRSIQPAPKVRPTKFSHVPEFDIPVPGRITQGPANAEMSAIAPPSLPAPSVRLGGAPTVHEFDLPQSTTTTTPPNPTPARALKQAPPDGMPVATWAAQALGFQADPIQTEILNTHSPRLILCCTRQWGKSSVAAVKALHLAAAKPGTFILIASASFKQSAELLRVIRRHAEKLLGARCKGDGINRGAIVLPNESRILALPQSPDTVRCFSAVDVIIIDEAAFVETAMHDALSPMLATTNGQLWLLSSANTTTGEFYKIWRGNGPEWRRFKVTAPECPRISPEFLAAERAAKGEAVFNREYLCDFTAIATVGVPESVVDDAFRGDVPAVTLPKDRE
jgi:hypothetical protein